MGSDRIGRRLALASHPDARVTPTRDSLDEFEFWNFFLEF